MFLFYICLYIDVQSMGTTFYCLYICVRKEKYQWKQFVSHLANYIREFTEQHAFMILSIDGWRDIYCSVWKITFFLYMNL